MKNEETKSEETTEMEKPIALRIKLKADAKAIRALKIKTKAAQRNEGYAVYSNLQSQLYYKRREYRHYHIACCELFGRTREQIERTVKGEEADNGLINQIKRLNQWTGERDEKAICTDQT